MKKLIIISALLVFTLSMSAQDNGNRRSRNPKVENKERKASSAVTPSRSSSDKSKATRTRPAPSENRSAVERNRSSSSRSYEQRRERSNEVRRSTNSPGRSSEVRRPSNSRSSEVRRPSVNSHNRDARKPAENPAMRSRENNRKGTSARTSSSGTRREATTGNSRNSYGDRKVNSSGHTGYERGNRYDPKVGSGYTEKRRVYTTPAPRRIVRPVPKVKYVPRPIEYRRIHYPYHEPARINIIWTSRMHREYIYLYPHFDLWYYPYGYRIHTVSAYDARAYIGEVTRIYGRVYETWHSRDTDEYYLYFGGPYPYHDFSIVLEGRDARKFSWRPERFFEGRHVAVTGLVSLWEGKPEVVVKKRKQLDIY